MQENYFLYPDRTEENAYCSTEPLNCIFKVLFVRLPCFFVYGMCSKKWNYTIGRNNENNKNIFNERRRSLIDTLEIMDADFKDEFLQISVVPWSWGTAHRLGVTGG